MKKAIFLSLFLISLASFAQDNFQIQSQQLTWQKIYNLDLDKNQIQDLLKKDPILQPIAQDFSGQSHPDKVSCSNLIFMQDQFQYFATVDFKPGKIRVTVTNINFIPSSTVELYGVQSSGAPVNAAAYFITKKGELKTAARLKDALACLDGYLTKKFQFAAQDPGQNW
jgi:hypothetical protein